MKLVVLTGIPGSGSTTLLNKALEEVDYVHLNYGDIMTEIAIKENTDEERTMIIFFRLYFFYYLYIVRVITLKHNNEELRNTNGCYLVTQFSSNPNNLLILR